MSFDAAGAAGADDSAAAAAAAALAAPRRARFSGSDDLRLLQGVRLYQPYAAEHGRKIRMWEKIAQELRLSTEKMGQVQLTGRAVSDRFQLLLKLHKAGTLKVKSPPATAAELHQVIKSMLRDISNHIDEIRASRGKPAKSYGLVTSSEAMRLHSDPEMATSELHVDEEEEERGVEDVEDGDEAAEGMALLNRLSTKDLSSSSSMREDDDTAVTAEDADTALQHGQQQQQLQLSHSQQQEHQRTKQQVLTAQLVALETEKLRLKKRKLAMLAQHHEEHMALLRQRLVLEERRFQEESAARRQELQLLFERLSQGQQQRSRSNSAATGTESA